MSLQKVLQCLLMGSPLLEKVSLVSLPCRLDHVLQHVLRRGELYLCRPADSAEVPPMPLGRVQHLDLMRTDVTMMTLRKMMQRSKRLKFVDVSYCWAISQFEWLDCKTVSDVKIVWL